jgi:hypothetical protein
MTLDYAQLKKILPQDCEFIGNRELVFNGLQSLYECTQDEITWIKPGVRNEKELINSTKASGIICSPESFQLYNGETPHKLFLLHHNPKQIFFKIVQYIYNSDLNKQSKTILNVFANPYSRNVFDHYNAKHAIYLNRHIPLYIDIYMMK